MFAVAVGQGVLEFGIQMHFSLLLMLLLIMVVVVIVVMLMTEERTKKGEGASCHNGLCMGLDQRVCASDRDDEGDTIGSVVGRLSVRLRRLLFS